MYPMIIAMALAAAQGPGAQADPAFAKAEPACPAEAGELEAIAAFFELGAGQTIAEYQPAFILTGCLAEAVRGRGRLLAVVEGGDRIVQVSRRITVQKFLKRDPARFSAVALVAIKPGKAVPAEHEGKVDRVVIAGAAADLVADPKRGAGLLRALNQLAGPGALLGIVDVPDKGGVDVARLSAIAREAGWEPAGQTSTSAAGLLLLRFRKA
jgi:hypothetical protein